MSERSASGSSVPTVNGWTGGQYSVYRLVLGVYLLAHFTTSLPRVQGSLFTLDSSLVATVLGVAAAAAAVGLAVGWRDRALALLLALVLDRKSVV